MSLQDKAMLVTLSVSCWTARKLDRKVGEEVDRAHGARDAGRYNKLLVDKQHLDPVTSYAGQIRAYHYKMTMPWMDNGARLLPSKLFKEYSAEMRKMKNEYSNLVIAFLDKYEKTLVQEARLRLGTLYDPEDYPPRSDLRMKFDVELDILPVPDGADFRVDIGDAERARIREDIAQRMAERQAAAVRDAWKRVRETVGKVVERLTAPKAVVHESLVGNAEELARILPGLNINDDPVMADVTERIIDKLLVPTEKLRRSAAFRREVAAHAQGILDLCPTV